MTDKDKELLIKDLCCRLPYRVICKDTNINVIGTLSQIGLHYNMCSLDKDDGDSEYCHIFNCKPYLFPLSSMTEEQKIIYGDFCYAVIHSLAWDMQTELNDLIDWFNKNHFDYRGLIEKGLAIDATDKNIY